MHILKRYDYLHYTLFTEVAWHTMSRARSTLDNVPLRNQFKISNAVALAPHYTGKLFFNMLIMLFKQPL